MKAAAGESQGVAAPLASRPEVTAEACDSASTARTPQRDNRASSRAAHHRSHLHTAAAARRLVCPRREIRAPTHLTAASPSMLCHPLDAHTSIRTDGLF